MNKRWWIVGIVALVIVIALVWKGGEKVQGECAKDEDCTKDACCHAKGCVSLEKAPKCEDIFCSQECAPGTLDCGQGSCKCVNNKCEAITSQEIANPASVYCEEKGGKLEIRTDGEGSQYGICILTNGTECDEWAYYRGTC